ncbi:MAG: phenylalanine--tRNA ligase subunit alpha [Calditrichaceae bacterium]|nr:phenylalanine--tRNA ligase subunit alpha [Calditrichaceae bacterium]MBN2709863.1 phenylalanine--tRNA ligase subunit alpha [Calditrichaceae bacterium]RQV92620.1 MAG: phenylalanine--tRNA ligase subunit alpha [Calditrichota bacterium]
MIEIIENIKKQFEAETEKVKSLSELEELRIKYLGRKGNISNAFSLISDVPAEQKPQFGKELNQLKQQAEAVYNKIEESFKTKSKSLMLDLTLPGRRSFTGSKHPLIQTAEEIKGIFSNLGFVIEDGPEIETDYYNFGALNFPENHPSRDMQDTLFISKDVVLRTHTSPVQIRVMEKQKPPIRMIAPGRVYRRDTPDASHSPFFHQIEGLVVSEGVTFADLKGVIESFAHIMFGKDINVRFRPSFFPFTEPSVEYDFSCVFCRGKGCKVCKGTGWVEISGAGMVHPNVFKSVGYDPKKYTGYAFGMGVDRIAMLKYNINDIRIFFENDVRFLNQF